MSSTVTLTDLLSTPSAPCTAAAAQWRGLADDLDRAADELNHGTQGLSQAWPSGPAAGAATAKVDGLRAEVNAAYVPANRIAQALEHHASAMADLSGQAQKIIDAARARGFVVDVAGATVTAPASMWQPATAGQPTPSPHPTPSPSPGPDPGASTWTRQSAQAAATDIAGSLGSLVARARGLDDTTVAAITQSRPDPATGFGALPTTPLSRDEVLRMRGQDPRAVNDWWRSLTPLQQEQAIRDHPDLVGWLDGVPATDRDQANRRRLAQDEARLRQQATDLRNHLDQLRERAANGDRAAASELGRLQGELDRVAKTLDRLGTVQRSLAQLGPNGLLLGTDPAGDGKAIISVGNPDTARHTAVWVPGLGTDLGSTRGNVNRVLNLYQEADLMTPDVAGDVATVMWLGYDAPEATNASVAFSGRSRDGGTGFDTCGDGRRTTHDPGPSHLTAVGHSYGSTVVAEAALHGDGRHPGLAVDDIVTAGSPGMHTDHAADLGLDPQHVWAGSAPDDPVSNPVGNPYSRAVQAGAHALGPFNPLAGVVDTALWAYDHGHNISPHQPDFGANQYVTDTSGHSDYWNSGSQSIKNQARVVMGQYQQVGLVHGEAP